MKASTMMNIFGSNVYTRRVAVKALLAGERVAQVKELPDVIEENT
jgi:hypothetical protein